MKYLVLTLSFLTLVACSPNPENNRHAGGGTGMQKEEQVQELNTFSREEDPTDIENPVPEAYRSDEHEYNQRDEE